MTPEHAKQFDYYSERNAEILRSVCAKCEPYKSWFTFNRWLAQGKAVTKGQHGTKIIILVERVVTLDNGTKEKDLVPRKVAAFCQHQIA